eukprot:4231997-Prymnesium_polylepis.1
MGRASWERGEVLEGGDVSATLPAIAIRARSALRTLLLAQDAVAPLVCSSGRVPTRRSRRCCRSA